MELFHKIRDLVRDNPGSKFFFILGTIVTIVLQLVIYTRYADTVEQLDRFVRTEIESEIITEIKTRPYLSGRGNYKSIRIDDEYQEYPILLTGQTEDRLTDVIEFGSSISKSPNSRDFVIVRENKEFEFRLMNLKDEMMILMVIGFILTVSGTVFAAFMVTQRQR